MDEPIGSFSPAQGDHSPKGCLQVGHRVFPPPTHVICSPTFSVLSKEHYFSTISTPFYIFYNIYTFYFFYVCLRLKFVKNSLWQTDRQKATHMSPPCNMHRWAQKVVYLAPYSCRCIPYFKSCGQPWTPSNSGLVLLPTRKSTTWKVIKLQYWFLYQKAKRHDKLNVLPTTIYMLTMGPLSNFTKLTY